jgi:hypothetical protein
VIQDLDGATSEPSRRRHMAALSSATAVLAFVMFYVLVAPPTFVSAPQAASPSPTSSAVVTVVSNPLNNMPLEVRSTLCAEAGTTWASFQLAVGVAGETSFVVYDRMGSRPVAFVQEAEGTGRFIVTCVTPDRSAPQLTPRAPGPLPRDP